MANTSFNFNVDPYYDDFEEPGGPREQNYMRMLFRPGYAVQARELTQLQTILQNQIRHFGDHIFQDGSPVEGGHLTFDNSVKSLKLQPQYQNSDINIEDFDGKLIGNTDTVTSTVRAKVVAADADLIRPTLVFKYLTGNQFSDSQEIQALDTATKALANASGATSNASVVSINEGIFYVDGYFVYVAPQTIIVDAYYDKPTAKIGLQIVDSIVDESADASLLDPAQGSFNYQAPGATRYQFNLELSKRTLDSTDDSRFFELLRVENGEVTKQVNYPIYPNIEKVLARRTFDESGHYTVKPFRVSAGEHPTDSEKFRLNIEPGKAYVGGYEFQTFGTVSVDIDKARTTNTSTDYSFSLDYGNYVIASNVFSGSVSGFAKILTDVNKTVTVFDLHAVPSANINTATLDVYSNTKIGTAKFRNIDYAGTAATGEDQYYLYLFDINMDTPTFNVVSGTSTTVELPATFSSVDDAYNGVKVRINTGPGSDSYTRTITAYDGASKNATVDLPFSATPTDNTQVTFVYTVQDIDSLVIPGTPGSMSFGTGASHFSADISIDGKTPTGRTTVFENSRNKLYYELPQQHVANGTGAFTSVEYYFRHSQSGISVSGGAATIPLVFGATLPYGEGVLSSTVAKNNFLVIDESTGEIVELSNNALANVTISAGVGVVNFDAAAPPGPTVTIISTQKINTGTTATKALITADSEIDASHTPSTATAVQGTGGAAKIDAAAGLVWLSGSYISRTPGVAKSLYLTDVLRIIKIYDSQDAGAAPSLANAVDVTERYVLDSGQRDGFYDYASITLRGGFPSPKGQLVVFLEYYTQSGGPYVSSASYPEEAYANNKIPRYTSSNRTVELRDCIDFRPRRTSALVDNPETTFKLENAYVPAPEYFFETTYNFYVPRKDRLILTKDKEFKLVAGVPAYNPVYPLVSDDGMILYNVNVPAYTPKISAVGLEYLENKRYTMRDIGLMEKRIENLEYYTSLSILELQAKNQSILYEDNVFEKEKYGIVVDDFSDFSVADVRSAELQANISKSRLGPYRIEKPIRMKLTSGTTIKRDDKVVSLSYTEEPCVVQETATKGISVQPFQFAEFQGTIKLTPESDYWYSTNLLPDVIGPVPVETPTQEETPDAGAPYPPVYTLPYNGYGIVDLYGGWFIGGPYPYYGYNYARYSNLIPPSAYASIQEYYAALASPVPPI